MKMHHTTHHALQNTIYDERQVDIHRTAAGAVRWTAGTMTVETAVVIPLLLGVVMLLLFWSVFLYNRAAAVSLTGRAVVLAAGMEQESSHSVEQRVNAWLQEGLRHLPLTKSRSAKGSASLLSASAKVSLQGVSHSFFGPLKDQALLFEDKRKVQRLDPAGFIWSCRIAASALGGKEKTNHGTVDESSGGRP